MFDCNGLQRTCIIIVECNVILSLGAVIFDIGKFKFRSVRRRVNILRPTVAGCCSSIHNVVTQPWVKTHLNNFIESKFITTLPLRCFKFCYFIPENNIVKIRSGIFGFVVSRFNHVPARTNGNRSTSLCIPGCPIQCVLNN